jgi:hypothetical protein
MINRNLVGLAVGAVVSAFLLLHGAPALAATDDSVIVTVGVKDWINEWDSWFRQNVFFRTGPIQIAEPINSSTRSALIPSLSVKYGDFLVSGSYLARQTYSLTGSQDSLSASRSEFDATIGYYILPGLALAAGYKQVLQDYGGGAFKWTGPTIAVLPAVLMNSHIGIYGVASYGLFNLKVPEDDADASGRSTFNADYALAEAGLSYALGGTGIVKAIRITGGFRAQILTTKGYKLSSISATGSPITPSPYEHDVTYGPTIGLSGSF